MEVILFQYQNNKIIKVEEQYKPNEWVGKINWVNIKCDDRTKVADYLEKIPFINKNRKLIEFPSEYSIPKVYSENIIQNLIVSKVDNIYQPDFISLIVFEGLIISILPGDSKFDTVRLQTESVGNEFDSLGYYFTFITITEVLAQAIL